MIKNNNNEKVEFKGFAALHFIHCHAPLMYNCTLFLANIIFALKVNSTHGDTIRNAAGDRRFSNTMSEITLTTGHRKAIIYSLCHEHLEFLIHCHQLALQSETESPEMRGDE